MLIIWIALILGTSLAAFAEKSQQVNIQISSACRIRISSCFLFVTIAFLVAIAGLRSSIGDTGYYLYSFVTQSLKLKSLIGSSYPGYDFFEIILSYVSPHPQTILLAASAITVGMIVITLWRKSAWFSLSIFLFITSGAYVSTMNGLRQYLVAAILFYAIDLLEQDRRPWKYFILVISLSTIHLSALIMIPVYFIVRRPAWSFWFLAIISGLLLISISDQFLWGLVKAVIGQTQYSEYINLFGSNEFEGANFIRVLVAGVPMLLAIIFHKRLFSKMPYYNVYANFSVLGFVTAALASYSWIFARLDIYFGLYNLILIAAILRHCTKKNARVALFMLVFLLYCVFLYFELQPYTYTSYLLDINADSIGPLTRSVYN